MKNIIIQFILILVPFMVSAQDSISIKLDKAGTLKKEMKKYEKGLTVLCISGPINNKDIAYVRTLPSLRKLDIRNATITQGGGSFKVKVINNNGTYEKINLNHVSIHNGKYLYEKVSVGVNNNGDSYIGRHVFSDMSWETVLLPADLKRLEEEVFINCKNLKVLQLPDAASMSINFEKGITQLDHLIFLGESNHLSCPSMPIKQLTVKNLSIYEALKKEDFDNSHHYSKKVQVIHTIEDSHYILNQADGYRIPKYVDIISQDAFFDCDHQRVGGKVIIPQSVRYIKDRTFYGSYIEEVVFESNSSIKSLGNEIFMGCRNLQKVILPDSLESIGHDVFSGCIALSSITFPTTLHSIGAGAFYDCRRLSSIVLPQNLKQLGSGVFSKCDNLKSVVVKAIVPPIIQGQLGTSFEDVYIPTGTYEAYTATRGWQELPLCYSGMKKKFSLEITAPGNLEKDLAVKVGKPYYKVASSIQLIGDINTDDLEALHCLVNLEEIDLSQTTLFYGEKLKKAMQERIAMLQLVGGLISLSDKVADEEYKHGNMSTRNYIGNKLLNKTISGGSTKKLEKGMDQLSEDWKKKFSESMHDIPDDSFKGYSRLRFLKLPRGVSSISVESFHLGAFPKVYTSDNEQIIELEKEAQSHRGEVERRRSEEEKNRIDERVFDIVENMPGFPGGQAALIQFLNENIKYPANAQENGIQGRVLIQFVVKADGSIENAVVNRGVSPELDKEALRVVNSMPKWKPGTQSGRTVNVKFTVPVIFRAR